MVGVVDLRQSRKLENVCYDIRGPVLDEAKRLEEEGRRIIKLNIGNPAPFGFEAPDEILVDVIRNLPTAQGYCDSQGLLSARTAIVQHYQERGIDTVDVDDVWLGNGVSELITLSLQAMLDNGDEVLVPAPDYPLWTAATSLAGGQPVHYLCDESAGWQPDLDDLRSKISDRTKAIVVINPNNPTGAVYSEAVLLEIANMAREHGLVIMADEIYDKILYDDAVHVPFARLAPDVFTLTFNGLSKAYRVAGFRSGWMMVSGPKRHATSYIEGVTILANMRLCANVPAQHAVQVALGGRQSIRDLILPGGRLREQRNAAVDALRAIPGVTCTVPQGALYVFPRLDPDLYPIQDDQKFVLELLRAQHVLVVQGTGFNWPHPDHLRIVTLPRVDELTDAIGRLGEFLGDYSGEH
ncbi:MAG: alanine-synthesizing transaminase [Pseudonocardiales bacterium]|jgi:alanine-synthesizing transaminase|nr:alanine-synthesizing transaminase [Pseudonocardiales bacterium]MDT4906519.1 alanine-synthesizing transaminase [Pseudonocardiales bacterium]MDT4929094.1 alanine-synthesizing transaminase [Pseudonocardiales bacterium]MDT4948305.1 alanine-synthesizing transaminase [Pseudonocardiales bacterium]